MNTNTRHALALVLVFALTVSVTFAGGYYTTASLSDTDMATISLDVPQQVMNSGGPTTVMNSGGPTKPPDTDTGGTEQKNTEEQDNSKTKQKDNSKTKQKDNSKTKQTNTE